MPEPTDAYLSVIDWPDSLDPESRAHALVTAAGLDLFTARQRVARGTPQVIARLPESRARGGLDVLHRAGATAFAPIRDDFAAFKAPLRAKRIAPAEGAPEPMYMVEAWRGEGRGMLARDLFVLVRARVTRARTVVSPDPNDARPLLRQVARSMGVPLPIGSADRQSMNTAGSLSITEFLDVHLADGSRIRINGDKFSFDVLGAERSYTDRENMDRLALSLARSAPGAMVDTAFARFSCPPDITRDTWTDTGAGAIHARDDGPAFDFYSCWACLMYRRLLAR